MLSDRQNEILQALVNRIIPADDDPGGWEAGVGDYLAGQFNRDLRQVEPVYALGLESLDAEARAVFSLPFDRLPDSLQDELLGRSGRLSRIDGTNQNLTVLVGIEPLRVGRTERHCLLRVGRCDRHRSRRRPSACTGVQCLIPDEYREGDASDSGALDVKRKALEVGEVRVAGIEGHDRRSHMTRAQNVNRLGAVVQIVRGPNVLVGATGETFSPKKLVLASVLKQIVVSGGWK